jgi:SAM-dependent methyltransferase
LCERRIEDIHEVTQAQNLRGRECADTEAIAVSDRRDPYATDVHRWWSLSGPSPELVRAVAGSWLAGPGPVLDLGCGLGSDAGYLADQGFAAVGVDLSYVALRRACAAHANAGFLQADVLHLPIATGSVAALLDRGCFHYLEPSQRPAYAAETRRVLRPGGRLFLRACLNTAGKRNDIDEPGLRSVFTAWRWLSVRQGELPSDTRSMPALIVLLERGG